MTAGRTADPAVELSTRYLGLQLRSPLVASSGPLTGRLDSLRELDDAGIGAVVLPSLFEEQVVHDELSADALAVLGEGINPEAMSYFPDLADRHEGLADRYLRHVEEARDTVGVPVIASLNGVTPGGWTRYAGLIADAGADALELNLYTVAADRDLSGAQVEDAQVELVRQVVAGCGLPVAVKVGPHYSAFGHMAARLVAAGAAGLVLFNRFYQPELDPDTRVATASLQLSTPAEMRLPLRWVGLLSGLLDASLALTTGVHSGRDAAKALLAGADVVMMTSALLHHGPAHVETVEAELVAWAAEHGYRSVDQLRGSASQANAADPSAFERANYMQVLISSATAHEATGGRLRDTAAG